MVNSIISTLDDEASRKKQEAVEMLRRMAKANSLWGFDEQQVEAPDRRGHQAPHGHPPAELKDEVVRPGIEAYSIR